MITRLVAVLALTCVVAEAREIRVSNTAGLMGAVGQARPGDVIRLAPGTYQPGVSMENVAGEEGRPIVIEGEDPEHPPVFEGGVLAFHLMDCSHVVLRQLVCRGQSGNGINVDDAGTFDTPSHHVVIEDVTVTDVGPGENRDAIKLSGVTDFAVRRCLVRRWTGQPVDMVGCHRGVIEWCIFGNPTATAATGPVEGRRLPATGPQMKGGSSEIVIRRCKLYGTAERAINIGGATDLEFFRPLNAPYEAAKITVEGCEFRGSTTPLAFVGVDGAVVRYNTIEYPEKWLFRVLQETTGARFVASRNVTMERNVFVFRAKDCPTPVNVGPGTAPETFVFKENWWWCEDEPGKSKPNLPVEEVGGVYGKEPQGAGGYGADALK